MFQILFQFYFLLIQPMLPSIYHSVCRFFVRQFLIQLAGDANIANQSSMEVYTGNRSWYDNVPAEEIATAMLAEKYSEIKK